MQNKLDEKLFFPEIFQAVAGDDYTVYAYLNDGSVRLFDAKQMIDKGGIFACLKDQAVFKKTLTVIGNTIAWDLEGNRDEYKCLDVDPFDVYHSPVVMDMPSSN